MSDQHHDALPPPEPDNIPLGSVVFWGVGSFVAVVVVIVALTSYFWIERERIDQSKLEPTSPAAVQAREAQLEAQKRLSSIEQAMQTLANKQTIE